MHPSFIAALPTEANLSAQDQTEGWRRRGRARAGACVCTGIWCSHETGEIVTFVDVDAHRGDQAEKDKCRMTSCIYLVF